MLKVSANRDAYEVLLTTHFSVASVPRNQDIKGKCGWTFIVGLNEFTID